MILFAKNINYDTAKGIQGLIREGLHFYVVICFMFRCKNFYQIAENKNVDRRMTCVNRITVVYEQNYF
jgi:hypothetical protein